MSRRGGGQLFVGRLSRTTRNRDLEDIFEPYGRISRCDIKYAYAFIDYEDRKDADDALRYENGREVCGTCIVVEWAKGNMRRSQPGGGGGGPGGMRSVNYDECYKCRRTGHWARDCPDDGGQYGGSGGGGGRYAGGGGGGRSNRRSHSPQRRSSYRQHSRSRSRSKGRSRSRTPATNGN